MSYYFNRGNIYFALAQYDSAFEDYQYTIELDPDIAQAYVGLGNVYYMKKHMELASKYMNVRLKVILILLTHTTIWEMFYLINKTTIEQ